MKDGKNSLNSTHLQINDFETESAHAIAQKIIAVSLGKATTVLLF